LSAVSTFRCRRRGRPYLFEPWLVLLWSIGWLVSLYESGDDWSSVQGRNPGTRQHVPALRVGTIAGP